MAASTPHQRLHVRCLLTELEISSLHVTVELLPYCERAGITTWQVGDRIDDVLNAITGDQARALARALISPELATP
ncbi:MAG: hypothetical protein J0H50_10575 [Xanthomonadales bacterium]|nr:hypothetical protein [Xanthomonadales bacterium]